MSRMITAIAVALGVAAAAEGSAGRPHTSLGPIKQIDAGVLNIGYAEAGPAGGTAVVLLHGWPYDIHSFVDVAPILAAKGYHVIVPYLRGYGTTQDHGPPPSSPLCGQLLSWD